MCERETAQDSVLWPSCQEFLTTDSEVSGSITDADGFSEWQWVWNGVHSAIVRLNEGLFE
jgi:hypothetical protein